jgi:hypothetical protein
MRKRKNGPTLRQIIRRAKNVLRRNGMDAGKRYAAKMHVTLDSADLRRAATWWERAKFRAAERARLLKELGYGGYKLYRYKVKTARLEELQDRTMGGEV